MARRNVAAAAVAALVLGGSMLGGQAACAGSGPLADSDVITTYEAFNAGTSVSWFTCGHTRYSSGCYGAGTLSTGTLSGFQHVCALLQGLASTTESPSGSVAVVTRSVYVLDGGGSGGAGLALSVFRRTDTVSLSGDVVNVQRVATVGLPAPGGPSAACFLAANAVSLYVSSSSSPVAVRVDKSTLDVSTLVVASPPATISSITADDRGDVSVLAINPLPSFVVYGPDDTVEESGGGAPQLLSAHVGLQFPVAAAVILPPPSAAQR